MTARYDMTKIKKASEKCLLPMVVDYIEVEGPMQGVSREDDMYRILLSRRVVFSFFTRLGCVLHGLIFSARRF